VVLASCKPRIVHLPQLDVETLLDVSIVRICDFMGVKDYPEPYTTKKIISFITTNHKLLAVEELELAFEMCANGVLVGDDYKTLSAEHYNSFNIVYLGKVLRAYYNYREKEKTVYIKQTELEDELKEDKERDERIYNEKIHHIGNLCRQYDRFLKGEQIFTDQRMFSFLTFKKQIKLDDSTLLSSCKEKAKIHLNIDSDRGLKENKLFQSTCKTYAIESYFNDLKPYVTLDEFKESINKL